MAALTADRNTPIRAGEEIVYPVSAGKKCYAGGLAVMNAGTCEPGSTAVGLVSVGRFEEQVDNSLGQDGDAKVKVRRGCFRFGNSSGADEVTLSEVGAKAYIVDDATVAKTSATNTRSEAGVIVDVDDLGVWINI
ncbi:hypothetical protein SAMN04488503_2485 [Humidesulfovibrio mexicanus]|uniref:Bacteriophage lambda head decoration protein D n=1 Tax=Humidesulfovibrio mexicanus TaxID=147047 RepID=A0A239BD06_9BACT|nr:hypothetical protein [Humidesulfovibrio mexicanus]SNS05716.1 hypothetical protein SAMN04488503_2485 [Humidesulfovibrio mexicanus]